MRAFALAALAALAIISNVPAHAQEQRPNDVFQVVSTVRTCSMWRGVSNSGYRWRYSDRNRYNGEVSFRWGESCQQVRILPATPAGEPGEVTYFCKGGVVREAVFTRDGTRHYENASDENGRSDTPCRTSTQVAIRN